MAIPIGFHGINIRKPGAYHEKKRRPYTLNDRKRRVKVTRKDGETDEELSLRCKEALAKYAIMKALSDDDEEASMAVDQRRVER